MWRPVSKKNNPYNLAIKNLNDAGGADHLTANAHIGVAQVLATLALTDAVTQLNTDLTTRLDRAEHRSQGDHP